MMLGIAGTFGYCNIFVCNVQEATITSFEDCVRRGFFVDDSDPPKCIVSKDKVFQKPEQNIRVTEPKAAEYITSPFTIQGEALVQNNTVYYRLIDEQGVTMSEGSEKTDSMEHGRFGAFSFHMTFDKGAHTDGTLLLFEKDPDGKEQSMVQLPVRFVKGTKENDAEAGAALLANNTQVPAARTLDVPFTPQAPFADWNSTFNEACEEASLVMAEYTLRGEGLNPTLATSEITLMVDWEKEHGYGEDITIRELSGVAETYYHRKTAVFFNDGVTVDNIKKLIAQGHAVIIPAAGQLLNNPHYRGDGPPYHMMIIIGYDGQNFITNDPGTKSGEKYAYSYDTLMNALHDWTGDKTTMTSGKKAMMVVY